MGVAMLAGYGVGVFTDLDRTAREWIRTGSVFSPNRQMATHYAIRSERYQQLLELMHQWSRT